MSVCEQCKYFQRRSREGECHRYPPTIISISSPHSQAYTRSLRPNINALETACGEFISK